MTHARALVLGLFLITPVSEYRINAQAIDPARRPRIGAGNKYAAHYRYQGVVAENDLTATPGAVRTTDKETICSTSTKTLRKVKHSDHVKTFTMYGVKCGTKCGQLYEVDHLISLEIGGTNDLANLWPQPYAPPGAKQKDVLENKLHRMICDGTMTAVEAQRLIVQDWYGVYKKYVKQPDVKLGR